MRSHLDPVEIPIERRPARGVLSALVATAIILGNGVAGALMLLPDPAASAGGQPTVPAPAPAPAAAGPADPLPPTPTGTTTRPGRTTLRQQAIADRAAVQKVAGRWIPQLLSTASGEVAGGVRFDEERILAEFRALRTRFPDAALLRSGDYGSFPQPGRWVVVLARGFASAAAANNWCDRQDFGPEDCFAKRLSSTGDPSGNTVYRR